MEDFAIMAPAKIDNEAPSFKAPYYNPKDDSDAIISNEDLK
jgi:hypothetical protein